VGIAGAGAAFRRDPDLRGALVGACRAGPAPPGSLAGAGGAATGAASGRRGALQANGAGPEGLRDGGTDPGAVGGRDGLLRGEGAPGLGRVVVEPVADADVKGGYIHGGHRSLAEPGREGVQVKEARHLGGHGLPDLCGDRCPHMGRDDRWGRQDLGGQSVRP